jgi:F-box protein 11
MDSMSTSTKVPKPKVEVDRSPSRCPFCHESVRPAEDVWVACAECLARHHKECWQDGTRCGSCGQVSCLEPAGMTVYRSAAPPKPKGDWPTLVVAKKGGGDFTSIAAAIRAAQPGTRIFVDEGSYHEGIVLEKPLALIARGHVTLESNGSDCVLMRTDQAMVRGMTLRARAGISHVTNAVVRVEKGTLRLWDCDVSPGSAWPAVSVTGSGAPDVRRCRLHGGRAGGILVSEQASGTFEDCEVEGFGQYGIGIKTSAVPSFTGCRVGGCPVGIFADENGRGSFKDCEVWNASDAGVRIMQGASPLFGRTRIHECGDGVAVAESGEGAFDECAITESRRSNVLIERAGHPTFTRCKIDRSEGNGVTVTAAGLGRFEDCTVNENGQAGVAILLGASPRFERSRIRRNRGAGIWVRRDGHGVVEQCDLTQNDVGPWLIEGKCQVHRKGNRE